MRTHARIAAAAIALATACSLAVAAPADAAPAAKKQTVTLIVTSDGTASTTIAGNGSIAIKDHRGTYSKSFTKRSYTAYIAGATTKYNESSHVSCKIKVNGKVVRSKSANGDFASVTCSWPY